MDRTLEKKLREVAATKDCSLPHIIHKACKNYYEQGGSHQSEKQLSHPSKTPRPPTISVHLYTNIRNNHLIESE